MSGNKVHVNKHRGHDLNDCNGSACKYFQGKRRGCKLAKCCREDERLDAIASERTKRKQGAMAWDG